ncbi:MAG: hypothetical protein CL677_08495 [Bdellovibrionaceae bacterium]|nr:hypothetical protein [Pseudobdellovibrionaceae bacterium]
MYSLIIAFISALTLPTFGSQKLYSPITARNYIDSTLLLHQNSNSYRQWKLSELHPEKVAHQVNNYELKSICIALRNYPTFKQVLFFPLITNHEAKTISECHRLRDSIIEFYRSAGAHLLQRVRKETISLIPSQIRKIDPTGGGFYVNADLAQGELNLTFDDGPNATTTPELLAILKDYQVKANFFVVGKNLERLPQIGLATQQAGHIIGNHSWDHKDLSQLSDRAALENVHRTFQLMEIILDESVPFFRFPFGAAKRSQRDLLKENNIPEFFWAIDTLDWKHTDPDYLFNFALEKIRESGKGIVLFHDIQPQTIAIMPALLETLNQDNFQTIVFHPESR